MLEFRAAPVPSFRKKLTADLLRKSAPDPGCRADSLGGLRVLITDACSEIGRATAVRLASHGAQVVLVAARGDHLVSVCEEIIGTGGFARWYRCDISALGDVDQLVHWVLTEFGTIDVLVNNASRPPHRPLTQSGNRFRDYQRMMAANYFGPLRLTLGLLPAMLRSGTGQVINVAAGAGPTPHLAAYAAAQAAWTTFGACTDTELAPHGIQVTAVQTPATDAAAAAHAIATAIRAHPDRVAPRLTRTLRGLAGVAPRSANRFRHALGI
ncbi:SDR family NAD(P)-dependent oxidoreductase [Nocardia goodfellowii]|uniref:NAD(P)-dependent dehydrogenase (Short-subunit alcohol dehydrogenase family) n=1 Tax=Nocardia goodfellowii TaxID=882446 RepID=A0ABS4QT83_9NOCA|nr:SDR family NAD(P)-dependent oxidoreductase [Nocardia goodfellowii]MBP2193811.1 NAD(P)-dependent dehydrogenase (short-subunit alcohol dehydrogenase family) [Nocardia goodfellowii]